MLERHFVLLILFPAVLHAQKAEQPCPAPQLDDGFVVHKKNMYPNGGTLNYVCGEGHKPPVEGWWATSTCENGQWSPKPQCIDEKACLPPTIPNGKYIENPNGWYAEHNSITVTCHDGFELKGQSDRGRCVNGTWSSLPVCERSPDACDEPPQIPHAVIIGLGNQKVFAANSKVLYECEGGYTTDGTNNQTSVLCSSGNWTGMPSCAQKAERPCPAPQLDDGDLVLTRETYRHKGKLIYICDKGYKPPVEGWWATSTCEYGQWSPKPQCIDEKACLPPTIPNGKYIENPNGWYAEHTNITVTCHDKFLLKGQSDRGRCVNGTWSSLPVCEKSPYACNEPPQIPYAVIIGQGNQKVFATNSKVLYECLGGYTTDGTTTQTSVLCSFGNWYEIPSCDFYCVIDPAKYTRHKFQVSEVEYLKEGKKMEFPCPRRQDYYSVLTCTNRRITYTGCCHENAILQGRCS